MGRIIIGSGSAFEQSWLLEVGLPALPEPMVLYRAQLRIAAERDVSTRPELATAFAAAGFDLREVQNKVHYVCNSEIERSDCEAAMAKRDSISETVAFESDGHPCLIHKESDIDRVLRLMNDGVEERKQFIAKPYRDRQQIVEALKLKFPDIPTHLFESHDAQWKDKAQLLLEFKRRMLNGENPVMLSKTLVFSDAMG